MLVLVRRVQEAIMIGDDVTVTVLSVKGNQVRLGFDAPKDVQIDREEIRHKKDYDNNFNETKGNR